MDPGKIWLQVDPGPGSLPARGWKLHLSATPFSAEEILARTVPLLIEEGCSFKVAASQQVLVDLNQGAAGLSQIGKFMTVYPESEAQAVAVARVLDERTRGLRGPRVPSDRPLGPGSLVHYRYGDLFPDGSEIAADGKRSLRAVDAPEDPFVRAGMATEPKTQLVAGRYLITSTLHRSVRGAIHLAIDVPNSETCILKRAWRDGNMMPDGRDARDRLREEASLLERLGPHTAFPKVHGLVEHDLDLVLVMDYVRGQTFSKHVHEMHGIGQPPSDETIGTWAGQLADAIERIHSTGFVHRDLNPENVIVRDDRSIALIDLELAMEQGGRNEDYLAGTPGYMSPGQAKGEAATIADDVYAIGALLYLAIAGQSLDPTTEGSSELGALGLNRSDKLVGLVASCLRANPSERPSSGAEVRALLS